MSKTLPTWKRQPISNCGKHQTLGRVSLIVNRLTQNPLMVAGLATAVVAGLWFVLAWRTPTSTFHFAPLIAGGIGPISVRSYLAAPTRRVVATILGMCAAIVSAAIAGLAAFDRLRGPTFWSPEGALTEVVLFAGIGFVVAAALLLVPFAASSGEGPA